MRRVDKHRFPSSPVEFEAWQRLLHGEPITEVHFLAVASWAYRTMSIESHPAALFDLLQYAAGPRGRVH
jgi:hypothetical protein